MSVIAVCSGKGSPGATFVAVNLAAAVARAGEQVMLLDLDPAGGDVAAYLGLDPRRGLYPLLKMDRGLPGANALLREAQERAGVFAVGGFPVASPVAAPASLAGVLAAARETERFVVADVGRVAESTAIVAASADLVVLVVRPDLVSVLGAERARRVLVDGGVAQSRIVGVVSGLERRRPADLAEVSRALGIPIAGAIPFERRAARKALIAQAPLSKGPVARAFAALASAIRSSTSIEPEAVFSEPVEATA